MLEVMITGENKEEKYKLVSPLDYYSHRYGRNIVVPSGFTWDGSSGVPDVWPFVASALHDYIYRTPTVPLTRLQADMIYYDCLRESGCRVRARIRLIGLRLLGSKHYKKRIID